MNGALYETFILVGTIDPQTVSNTEVFTDVINMANYQKALFIFALGDMASETIQARVVTCDSAGNNAAAFKTATELAASATANDNDQILIEVDGNDLAEGGTNAEQYVKGGLVTGGATGGPASCMVFAMPKNRPGSDLASVVEIVTAAD